MLWYAFLGCLVGTLVGVLPGIGPLAGISILLPVTFGLNATQAIIMLAGIYYGSQYGGSTTSILMRIPGEASSVMTCIDGYAMAKKGRAGAALCIAAVGSWIGGTFGVLVLTLVAPPLATIALRFGPPEYTALLVLGLIFLAYMSSSSLVRTLLMACLGLLLGMIGIDNMTGPFPLQLRSRRTGRRHRHRAGGGRTVRARRNSVDAKCRRSERHHQPAFARAVADPQGMERGRNADRARHAARIYHRHHSGLGAHHLQLSVVRDRKACLEASRAIRQGRGRRRRRPGNGQQCRLDRRLRADARSRHPDQPDHRGADRRADDSRRFCRPDAGQRAPRRVLGIRRLDVCRQPHAAGAQPAAWSACS